MGGRRWGRLASGFGAVVAVVAGVAVNQVGGDSAWPWQVTMASIAAIAMWLAATLSYPPAAKEPVSPPSSGELGPAPDVVPVSGTTDSMVQAREICGGTNMSHGPASTLPVPRQLPTDPASFVGRETDLATLDALLANNGEAHAVVISAIAGTGGVGKTTLAVHWAHQVRKHFPDGDLFVNLRGYDPGQPVTPKQALDGFLRALDVPTEKIPPELDAQAALFRSLLNGRRTLVVLDNAASIEQVRPLLPGTTGCLTLITSRSRLSGLATREGVARVPIDVLSPEHAVNLLRQVIIDSRVDAEPDKAAELARRCGYLPLALRIAADRAVTHPHLTLADLVEELVDECGRLDVLASEDDETTAVRAVFSWSYNKLPPDAARVFRLLGLNAGPDLSSEAAAALTGLTRPRVLRLLDTLTSQHLLGQTGRNRYRFHDLLRVYAAERAMLEESEAERSIALGRMLDWYLHTARAARRIIQPNIYEAPTDAPDPAYPPLTFSSHDEALGWFEHERTNLVTAVRECAKGGNDPATWRLANLLVPFLALRWYRDDWLETLQLGLSTARNLGDRSAQALMLIDLGDLHWELRRFDEAIEHHQRALSLSRNAGTPWTEGFSHHGLGCSYADLHRPDEAFRHFRQALEIFRAAGERRGEGIVLTNLGAAYRSAGQPEEAIACHRQAISILEETANDGDRAGSLRLMGAVYYDLRRFPDAIDHYRRALRIFREKRDRRWTARTLFGLGEAQSADHQTDAALRSWQEALAIFTDLGDPMADEIKTRLTALTADSSDT
ncbi:hypothetical protein GCM10029978_073900 [Actinoallomurus acanthiterrae]